MVWDRVFGFCLRAYPLEFRRNHRDALLETFEDQVDAAGLRGHSVARLALAESWDVVVNGVKMRVSSLRPTRHRDMNARSLRRTYRQRTSVRDGLVADVRFALRTFRRKPAVAFAAVLLLACGIGINTALFSVVNAYLLRAFPFPDAERLVTVRTVPPGVSWETAPAQLRDIKWPARDDVIEDAITWDLDAFTLVDGGNPEVVVGAWVPPSFFRALRSTPAFGRLFVDADGQPGAAPVAVLSHGLWQRRLGGDPEVVGKTVTVHVSDRPFDAEIFTVVGVLPENFWFVNRYTDILTNLTASQNPYMLRLQPGVTPDQAAAHLTQIVRAQVNDIDPLWPGMYVAPAHASYVQQVRPVLLVLTVAVGLVLLIACGNVALLLTVRAFGRQREFTVRRALGATRLRVTQQLATEGILLALTGGALGTVLAWLSVGALAPLVQEQLQSRVPGGSGAIGIDGVALGVAFGLSALTGLIFAIVPALATTGHSIVTSFNATSQNSSDTKTRQLMRNLVIGAEVAISLTLVIGSALMLRSALRLQRVDLGFRTENVLNASVNLRHRSYPEDFQLTNFVDQYLAKIRASPNVAAASILANWPFQDRDGEPMTAEASDAIKQIRSIQYVVTPGHFETMTVPLMLGRAFDERDRADTQPVVIVSESVANAFWPNRNPIGQRVKLGPENAEAPWRTVVGVTGDVRETLTSHSVPDSYIPYDQQPGPYLNIMIKTVGDPAPVVAVMREALWDLDPTSAVTEVSMLADVIGAERVRPEFLAKLLTVFGLFAAALALTGLYSIVAYAVSQRRKDVAIHMALGAGDRQVVTLFLRNAAIVIAVGIGAGLLMSAGLTRAIESQLFGISRTDLATYATTAILLAGAAFLAVWIPAQRATSADPMGVLRED